MNLASLRLQDKRIGYKDLARLLIEAIEAGELPEHTLLPPSRSLAASLGISRDTVMRCYKHLHDLSFLESRGTRGTFVRAASKDPNRGGLVATNEPVELDTNRLSAYASGLIGNTEPHSIAPDFPILNYGAVPASSLPIRRWRELMQTRSQPASMRKLQYKMEVLGRAELREALAVFSNRTKGISCTADEISVFNISFSAYSLICRLVLNPGDLIAVEDPGFGGIKNVASYLGFEVYPVPLDSEGLMVEKLNESWRPIKLVYISADHQEPTGITMSLARRKELLDWAQKNNAWILEDDYDGFFHYGKQPPPNLKSLDTNDRVIYFATFWQLLYPLTTMCFIVAPKPFMPVLTKSKIQTEGIVETMVQLAVSDLVASGFLQKHANKQERIFAVKRRALLYELKRVLGKRVQIPKVTGGTTCFLQFFGWSDDTIQNAARTAALPLLSAAYYYEDGGPSGQFLAYFAGLGDEREIKKIVENFVALLGTPQS